MSEKVSAVIVTLNEERALPKCLKSLSFADEILVIDSGSEDRTVEISQQLGARVIHQDWLGYGKQKQFGVDQAGHDWVLCVDADEWVSDELASSIKEVLNNPLCKGYRFPRCNRFLGRWLRHGEGYPDISLRLFDRRHGAWSDDPVHEYVEVGDKVGALKGDLMHESEEGLQDYLVKQNKYTSLQAEEMYAAGKRFSLIKILLGPIWRFMKFYIFRLGFLDGIPGLIHILIGCQNTFIKQVKVLERVK
jgi:glycosyltransferase involved in cell wall biosynthesis